MFADVIIPVPIARYYTYSIPPEFEKIIAPGYRVIVEFGKSKLLTGIVRRIHDKAPEEYIPKPIEHLPDTFPAVTPEQFEFWDWLSSYYMCSAGEVMAAALPSGMRLSSETVIRSIPGIDPPVSQLNEKEIKILTILDKRKKLNLAEVSKVIERKTVYPVIRGMIEKELITLDREVKQKYSPKKEVFIRLTKEVEEEKKLESVFSQLSRTKKQLKALMTYINISKRYSENPAAVAKKNLLATSGLSSSITGRLVKKGIFEYYEKEISRIGSSSAPDIILKQLSPEQERAIKEIRDYFLTKDVVLLHGVTSSGKTEIYFHLIADVLKEGKQVLYLLPEIALTAQIINRLKDAFGNYAGVYHSRSGENERVEIWHNFPGREGENGKKTPGIRIILGARSAIFLPFTNLGLVIADEEHDPSFKQDNPAPRYNARDAAIYLARIHGAKTVLGSATPAVETFFNAEKGKYGFVKLENRYGNVTMPHIETVNLADEMKKGKMRSHFSLRLIELITTSLKEKEQVILFQNRRGFSPLIQCARCGWIPHCRHCDVSLVYHKKTNRLMCHYCGHSGTVPHQCSACGDPMLQTKGFGTEKVEEELKIFFPDARVARMDIDSTRGKNSHAKIISGFEKGDIDILAGTQMVSKGLDFDRVAVVGILHADNILGFPDFRAHERGFQMLSQVSGRAGRKKKGSVVLQTFNPSHPVILQVLANDYSAMYSREITERKKFNYPPFCRLLRITLKNKSIETLGSGSSRLVALLKNEITFDVYGPVTPFVERIAGYYIRTILVKLPGNNQLAKNKSKIKSAIGKFSSDTPFRSIRIMADVDPVAI